MICVPDEEREQVERLRWPSRGYLQELNEYQQRRRKLRKSRCIVMWLPTCQGRSSVWNGGEQRRERREKMKNNQSSLNGHWRRFLRCCWFFSPFLHSLPCWLLEVENDLRLLNQQDCIMVIQSTDTPLFSLEEWLCVFCIMTTPSWENMKWLHPLTPIWIEKDYLPSGSRLCDRLYFYWHEQNCEF